MPKRYHSMTRVQPARSDLRQCAQVSWQTVQKHRRRLGVMGGTFDPIHYGHLVAASEVAYLFELDEVVFVPSGQPWQKDRRVSAAEDRYLMTVIATASNPLFSVSRVDIDRAGPTYTKDTLRDLHALNPDSELYFITGADALPSILSWQDWEELFAMARFVGVSRPGYELVREHLPGVLDELADDALTLVEIPALAISSTDCRQRAEQSRPLWYLMPDGVVQYVSKRRLYRKPAPKGALRPTPRPPRQPSPRVAALDDT
jgi:nicotinate-nucleotide adenylyltransferase